MDKEVLISKIVELELAMFLAVNAEGNPSCRESPDGFRTHRNAQFSAWSEACLLSYLSDLENAAAEGRNLMTYKYARMDDLIPSENESGYIEKILNMQIKWQSEVIKEYPGLMKRARGLRDEDDSVLDVSFERYLRAELESYSAGTLELLWKDAGRYRRDGINMSEIIYLSLVKNIGFNSLDSFK